MPKLVKNSKYFGKLNEQIVWLGPRIIPRPLGVLFETESEFEKRKQVFTQQMMDAQREMLQEQLDRLELLFHHYGLVDARIPHDVRLTCLLIRLAEDWVPGFQMKDLATTRPGRKKDTWSVWTYLQLLQDVNNLKQLHGPLTDGQAIEILVKRAAKIDTNSKSIYRTKSVKARVRTLRNKLSAARSLPVSELLGKILTEKPDDLVLIQKFLVDLKRKVYFRVMPSS